ncbi:MAG TPA: XdhC/CoxI family protein [Hanamia sp.]|nr:XdhC/CoxI family protein [Hanamia sp.]
MKEIQQIINAFEEANENDLRTALATVVHVDGSAYRRPGARMLVREDGVLTGAISGGCLEGDALRKAMHAIKQQQNKLVVYDTSDEDNAEIGYQLGCEGTISVLFEPIDPSDAENPLSLLKKAISKRQEAVLVTLFSTEDKRGEQPGTSLLFTEEENFYGNILIPELKDQLHKNAQKVFAQKKSSFKKINTAKSSFTAFFQFLKPGISLVIVGAGNDAISVVQIANSLGWEVSVIDGRKTHAKQERFESACQVLVLKPEKILEKIVVDNYTAFVLMTHNYNYDLGILKALLQKDIPYIGVLGPKLKLEKMLNQIADEGIKVPDQKLKRIYGPAGLEIGAETPEEIALSIIAEIKAVFANKPAGFLRDKKEVIHSRKDTLIQS